MSCVSKIIATQILIFNFIVSLFSVFKSLLLGFYSGIGDRVGSPLDKGNVDVDDLEGKWRSYYIIVL